LNDNTIASFTRGQCYVPPEVRAVLRSRARLTIVERHHLAALAIVAIVFFALGALLP
jgi:hypothetical protein